MNPLYRQPYRPVASRTPRSIAALRSTVPVASKNSEIGITPVYSVDLFRILVLSGIFGSGRKQHTAMGENSILKKKLNGDAESVVFRVCLLSLSQKDVFCHIYSKTCLKRPLRKKCKICFQYRLCLKQVKSIAECSERPRTLSFILCIFLTLKGHIS